MSPSYHDVIVYIDGTAHRIADNYAYELSCTRTGGWSLWWHPARGEAIQIGGEYHGGEFWIEVAGVVICGVAGEKSDKPAALPVGGWSGIAISRST